MIFLVDGLPGSGKSFWMTECLFNRWKRGQTIYPNYNLYFDEQNTNIEKWQDFDEVLNINGGEVGAILSVDEAYKVFDCRRFMTLPISFSEKLAEHRHDGIDIITATQNFTDLDKRVRDKVAIWFHCKSVFRFPFNQSAKPIIQILIIAERIRVSKKEKVYWLTKKNHWRLLSTFWTKKRYDSYANLKLSEFICRLKLKKGNPILKIASREAINRGKVKGF